MENLGLPTALITTLTSAAVFMGAYRIVSGCAINHPLGNPELSVEKEKDIRRKILFVALEALQTEVKSSRIFEWEN